MIACIIQARTGSTRLPNKIFLDLAGKPALHREIERVKRSALISKIAVLTPLGQADEPVVRYIKDNFPEIEVFRDENRDVLGGYYAAAQAMGVKAVVRITGDCPVIDHKVIDKVIRAFEDNKADYAANVLGKRTYPRGLDVEVISSFTLEDINRRATDEEDRKHVTLYLRKNPDLYSAVNVISEKDCSDLRLTLDEAADYELLSIIYSRLFPQNQDFDLNDILSLFNEDKEIQKINSHISNKYEKF